MKGQNKNEISGMKIYNKNQKKKNTKEYIYIFEVVLSYGLPSLKLKHIF